jgi:pimeloyl-ACP methyl ester carboxylesterase
VDILLIAGLWLDASVWDPVAAELRERDHHPVAISLPGQGTPASDPTLADQLAAVVTGIDGADGDVLVVGHSAASTLAWMAADARPERVGRIVMIGGLPSSDGTAYADFFPVVDGVMPFPGWEPFEGPDSADLDRQQRDTLAAGAIPVPANVATGIVHLSDPRRHDIPVTVICPEFSPDQAREWVDDGQVPELAQSARVEYVDIEFRSLADDHPPDRARRPHRHRHRCLTVDQSPLQATRNASEF